jgi:putative transcriptional regulator
MYGNINIWKGGQTLEIEIKVLELMAQKKIRHLTDLSKESGVTVQSLYNITNKKNEGMRLDTIAKLCMALDCNIDELIVIKK